MNAEEKQKDTRRNRSRRCATHRPTHAPDTRIRIPAASAPPPPAPYRRSRTWPSATSWERHRLSPGHRLQLWRGRGQGGRGRPPRLGGGRRRAGHWRREGPAVPTATAGHPADAALPDCRLRAGARPQLPRRPGRGGGGGGGEGARGPAPSPWSRVRAGRPGRA